MTNFIYANDINTTLSGSLTSGSTSMTLADASKLPSSIPAGSVLVITLRDQATKQTSEIVYASSVSGATLSGLARGQEGTSALSWNVGDYAYSPPTAGQMGNLLQFSNILGSLGPSGSLSIPVLDGSTQKTILFKWGTDSVPNSLGTVSTKVVTFPTPFPNACFYAKVNALGAINSSTGGNPSANAQVVTVNGFTAVLDGLGWASYNQAVSFTWFAIGN